MPLKSEYENYLKFVSEALELSNKIPKYFSKYSNHIYCNQQKLTILVLMQKLKLTYRGVVSFLRSNHEVRLLLGLYRIPVHTTLVRFTSKIKDCINLILDIKQASIVAIDSTGFELESKSYYYRNKWNSERKWKTKRYMKLSIVVDTNKQLILNYKIRKKLRHDNIDFKYLLNELKINYLVADKGYDSKENRLFVIKKLKAIPNIPYRINSGITKLGRIRVFFDIKSYHQRSKVETVFSVIKRRYGSVLRSRSFITQKVELISKLITYNLDRQLNYIKLLIRGLHQSP